MDVEYRQFENKRELYGYICNMAEKITAETSDTVAVLSNISALLMLELADVNWSGFYIDRDGRLVLGPFQGKPAVAEIAYGKGVCGTAYSMNETRIVENVHKCENHIACDFSTSSEIVVPIRTGSGIYGVIDIDSPVVSRFDEEDREGLEKLACIIADKVR